MNKILFGEGKKMFCMLQGGQQESSLNVRKGRSEVQYQTAALFGFTLGDWDF